VSIPVDLEALRSRISTFGTGAFLVTTSSEGPPHISSVTVTIVGDRLAMGVGRKTRANVELHPAVSVMWPAGTEGSYCLIVDATAVPDGSETLLVQPTSAVLHRLATAPSDIANCEPI
jgi:hypothetical protein